MYSLLHGVDQVIRCGDYFCMLYTAIQVCKEEKTRLSFVFID